GQPATVSHAAAPRGGLDRTCPDFACPVRRARPRGGGLPGRAGRRARRSGPPERYDRGLRLRMRKDSLAFAVSGIVFGLLVGWIIGTQQVPDPAVQPPAPAATAAAPAAPAAPPVDQARVQALEEQAAAEPRNVQVRLELANL